jgi:hypothetical protein
MKILKEYITIIIQLNKRLLDNQQKAGIMMFAEYSWFFRMELET